MSGPARRLAACIGLVCASSLLGGCFTVTSTSSAPVTQVKSVSAPKSSAAAGSITGSSQSSGLDTCALDSLPAQAADTVAAIHDGGPFVRSKDGGTYQNRGGQLPRRPGGFYREYTVKTPGSSSAGARRIVTGGNPKTHPQWYFYTGDHYDTFCEITGAD